MMISHQRVFLRFLFALGILTAAISVGVGVLKAVDRSKDFQYVNISHFVERSNPYQVYEHVQRTGEVDEDWTPPVYLQTFYLLFAPLNWFELETARLGWVGLNLACGIGAVYLLCRRAGLMTLLPWCLIIFLTATPVRNTIGIAQTSLVILFLFVASALTRHRALAGLMGAAAFSKYSFTASWLALFWRERKAAVWWALGLSALGLLVSVVWMREADLRYDVLGPLMVAEGAVTLGAGDLMTLLTMTVDPAMTWRLPLAVVGFAVNLGLVWWMVGRLADPLAQLAVAAVASLLFLNHLSYDDVFLLPALILFLKWRNRVGWVGLAAVLFVWHGLRVLMFLDLFPGPVGPLPVLVAHLANWVVLGCVWFGARARRSYFAAEPAA